MKTRFIYMTELENQVQQLEKEVRQLQGELQRSEADLASFIGESPLWISYEGFNRVYQRELDAKQRAKDWMDAALSAQAYLTPMSPEWQTIENLRMEAGD